MLKDPYPLVVAKACEVLGKMHDAAGVVSDTVAAEVAELMQDQHAAIRAAATEAVGRMPAQAREDFGTFVHHLEDAAWTVRRAAVFAISRSGPVGQMYASRFCRMMWDTSVGVRVAAIEALGEMGLRGALFIHEVESMTLEPVPSVSSAAAAAVKKLREAIAVDKEDRLIAATDEAAQAFEEEVDPVVAVTDPQKEDDATDAQAETLEVPVALPAPVAPAGLPPLPIALLFPGQGSQYVKMLSEAQKLPAVQSMLTKATEILGYDLLDLCLNGPEEKLAQTKYCQPALFVGGLAGVEMLRQERPEAVDRCQAVAGLSLGEYTALTFAGVFDFETGLRIVKLRGEAMESAAQASEQGMVSLAGLDQDTVEKLCAEAAQGDICRIANFLFPKGFSVAGSKAAVERLKPLAEAKGCLQAKSVKTAGAFHTDFMKPAGEKLLAALQEASEKLRPPKCDVYMNVTGARLERGSDPAVVVEMLSTQLTNSVMWEHSMRAMIADQVTEFYECGPMKQLKAMMKRIDPTAGKATINIAV